MLSAAREVSAFGKEEVFPRCSGLFGVVRVVRVVRADRRGGENTPKWYHQAPDFELDSALFHVCCRVMSLSS